MKTRLGGLSAGMASRSGIHRLDVSVRSALGGEAQAKARRSSVLVAHDAGSSACDALVRLLEAGIPGRLEPGALTRASSVQDAAELLRTRSFDVLFVSLDLQPAPQAAPKLADFALGRGIPVVLVTRSLRWLPAASAHLRLLPWVSPEATADELDAAMADALATFEMLPDGTDEDGERKSLGF